MADIYVATTGNDTTGTGTIGNPFLTIGKGCTLLDNPGDNLYIRGGTYNNANDRIWGADLTSGTNLGAGAITISAYPGETVTMNANIQIVKFPASPTRTNIIITGTNTTTDAQNLIIDGVNRHATEELCYFEVGNDSIRLQYLEIKRSWHHMCLANSNFMELLYCHLHHSNEGAFASPIGNLWYGAGNHHLIHHNHCHDAYQYAIRCMDSGGTNDGNCTIYDNYCHTFGQAGAGEGGGILIGGDNNVAYNNICVNSFGSGIQVSNNTPTANLVYSNTIMSVGIGIEVKSGSVNTVVRNNIAYSNVVDILNNGTTTTSSNNLTTDPSFVNSAGGNYHILAASSARDAGFTLGAPYNVDYDGLLRPQVTAYCIGAYEFAARGGSVFGGSVLNNPIFGAGGVIQ